MAKKRTLIIGDVHGCFEELMDLIEKVDFNRSSDRLIFCGDLINKGPRSLDVLNWVKENKAEVVLGNHELGLLRYLESRDPSYKMFEKLIQEMEESSHELIDWVKTFPLYIEEDNFIVVHGGMVPNMKLDQMPAHLITQIRTWDGIGENIYNKDDPAWYTFYKENKIVIYGHWAGEGLNQRENTIGLDTACCWGGKLSLIHLETKDIYQVDARREYSKW